MAFIGSSLIKMPNTRDYCLTLFCPPLKLLCDVREMPNISHQQSARDSNHLTCKEMALIQPHPHCYP